MSTQILIVGGGLGGTMLANQRASKLFDEVVRNDVRSRCCPIRRTTTTSRRSCTSRSAHAFATS